MPRDDATAVVDFKAWKAAGSVSSLSSGKHAREKNCAMDCAVQKLVCASRCPCLGRRAAAANNFLLCPEPWQLCT
ncbi:hypothetical protein GUJ93_ZPchr0005g15426 [Zizania palustris]|uniref:Uncharacterized protein n=1 Tax=Zizania palustris TaxID=103762 RepID=A0A8J5VRU2_ZIZPA|nr:hypothetical protein GUJ93_ZPchr0005g15426 [Zizania palustris]